MFPFKLLQCTFVAAAVALVAANVTAKEVRPAKLLVTEQLPQAKPLSAMLRDPSLKTAEGHELELVAFPATETVKYRFLVEGGLHGNEEQASAFVLWLAKRYARGQSLLNQLPKEEVAFDFLPFANPDGTEEKSRYNAHGVNLNRNFAVLWGLTKENPGKESFSEPETRAIRKLFQERRYTAAVDVHGYINWIVTPSAPEDVLARGVKATKLQAALYKRWVEGVKSEMQLLPGYQHKTGAALGDGGAFEDWAFWSEGTFAYCLEMETFQRFVRPYRRDFADLTRTTDGLAVDLYKRYEAFIYRTFAHAIELKKAEGSPDTLAVQ